MKCWNRGFDEKLLNMSEFETAYKISQTHFFIELHYDFLKSIRPESRELNTSVIFKKQQPIFLNRSSF